MPSVLIHAVCVCVTPAPVIYFALQYAVEKIGAAFGFDAHDASHQVKLRVGDLKGRTLRTSDRDRTLGEVGIRAGVLIFVKIMLKDRPPKWAPGGHRLSTHDVLAGAGLSAATATPATSVATALGSESVA